MHKIKITELINNSMKKYLLLKTIILSVLTLAAVSCSNKAHFTIKGEVTGATDSSMIYLSKRTLTETVLLDSVKLNKDGSFSIDSPAPPYPDFYLLTLGGQSINLAIDSIETIKVSTSASNFATDYNIEGSESSMYIKEIVSDQIKLASTLEDYVNQQKKGELSEEQFLDGSNLALKEYKDKALKIVLSDNSGMAGYFAIFQQVNGYMIYDSSNKTDLKAFQAVATRWANFTSPRAEHIKQYTLAALADIRNTENTENTIAQLLEDGGTATSEYYNIVLDDLNNKEKSLAELKGKVVILDFTSYTGDFSPSHSIELNALYSKFKPGLEVYQVSLDTDEHTWRNAAVNLPWVCVRAGNADNSSLIQKYNLQVLPTTFILDKDGAIVKRMSPNEDIAKEIQKLL